jgi:predicted dehydrogenase
VRPLRLGLLGTGLAADLLYLPALKSVKRKVRIVACCNRTKAKAVAFAKKAGVPLVVDSAEALFALPDLDAIFISLPIDLQPRYVLKALAAGKAVLSEKPVGPSYAAGEALIKAAKRYKPVWMVAENFVFMPHIVQAETWLAAGRLGDVRLAEVTQMNVLDEKVPFFHTSWRTAPKFKGGFVLDAGVHLAHVIRHFLGSPVSVRGLTAQFNPSLPPLDTALAVMRFQSGALGLWRSCFAVRHQGPMIKLYGSKADLEIYEHEAVLAGAKGKRQVFKAQRSSFALQFEHFADVVLKGARPKVTPQETLADLKFMQQIVSAH